MKREKGVCEREKAVRQGGGERERENGGPQGNRERQKRRVGGWEHMKGRNFETGRNNVATQSLCTCKRARDSAFSGFLNVSRSTHSYIFTRVPVHLQVYLGEI